MYQPLLRRENQFSQIPKHTKYTLHAQQTSTKMHANGKERKYALLC